MSVGTRKLEASTLKKECRMSIEVFKTILARDYNLSPSDIESALLHFEEIKLKPNDFLSREGDIVSHYYFIAKGALKISFEHKEEEITAWIAFEHEFFSELTSVKKQQPSRFHIQAIDDTTLLAIKSIDLEALYQLSNGWQRFGRLVWESAFLKVIDAVMAFQTTTAEERYLRAMKDPNLMQRVSLKDLSSYLGITQTSLSRLRKNIK